MHWSLEARRPFKATGDFFNLSTSNFGSRNLVRSGRFFRRDRGDLRLERANKRDFPLFRRVFPHFFLRLLRCWRWRAGDWRRRSADHGFDSGIRIRLTRTEQIITSW